MALPEPRWYSHYEPSQGSIWGKWGNLRRMVDFPPRNIPTASCPKTRTDLLRPARPVFPRWRSLCAVHAAPGLLGQCAGSPAGRNRPALGPHVHQVAHGFRLRERGGDHRQPATEILVQLDRIGHQGQRIDAKRNQRDPELAPATRAPRLYGTSPASSTLGSAPAAVMGSNSTRPASMNRHCGFRAAACFDRFDIEPGIQRPHVAGHRLLDRHPPLRRQSRTGKPSPHYAPAAVVFTSR